MARSGWKWMDMARMALKCWKWLEMDENDNVDAGESNGMALLQF